MSGWGFADGSAAGVYAEDPNICRVCGVAGGWAKDGSDVHHVVVDGFCAEHWRPDVDVGNGDRPQVEPTRIVPIQEFVAVDEPGAEPILGTRANTIVPENGDVMIYGDGGASKTTLSIDLGMHLAAGDDWLGIPVPKPVKVLLIEAEGVRPKFRDKLRCKLNGWTGSEIGDRLQVVETPWAEFRFPDGDEVAAMIGEREVDVLIVGPLSRIGWEELGTLQQVRDFMETVTKFRRLSGRPLTVALIHHENKGGKVSGAFEGSGDTLFHAEVHTHGKTTLTIQKARHASEWHMQKLELAWTDGEGFAVTAAGKDRDETEEIAQHLGEKPWRTAKEISRPVKAGGIGMNVDTVKGILETSDRFVSRTKEGAAAVGRHFNSTVWNLKEAV